jgi:ubiquinone/menaquinone biosynthesis C-methylase UbiE
MEGKDSWGNEELWIEVLEKKAYLPEKLIKIPSVLKLIENTDLRGKRVLDYGCGSGVIGELLKNRGADVVGTDVSRFLLEKASERIRTVWSDGLNLPFEDSSFDYGFSIQVFMVIEDLEKSVSELNRVLKNGGKMFFSFLHPFCDQWDVKSGKPFREYSNYKKIEKRTWVFHLQNGRKLIEQYIHRPFEEYWRILSKHFYITNMIEPRLPDDQYDKDKYSYLEYLFGEAVKRSL